MGDGDVTGGKAMRHQWTEDDDRKLEQAINECAPMRDVAKGPREVWWAMIVGRMGIEGITPGAARSRWEKLCKDRESTTDDAWKRTAQLVEEYEASLQERTFDAVSEIREMIAELRDDVAKLVAVWKD